MSSFREELAGVYGVPNLSQRVVDFHRAFVRDVDGDFLSFTKQLAPSLTQFYSHNPFFTDHGPGHSYRIIDYITQLEQQAEFTLNSVEKYLLACTAWTHDIGMSINTKIQHIPATQEDIPEWHSDIGTTKDQTVTIEDEALIREHHHILSQYFVSRHWEEIGVPCWEAARVIATLSKYHRRKTDLDELSERDVVEIENVRSELSPRSLAAIFRIADACDTDNERADELSSSIVQQLPPESQVHWQACQQITSVELDVEDAKIRLRGKYDTEEELALLERKTVDVYEEIEAASPAIQAHPLAINLADVICQARHEEPPYESRYISGREEFRTENRGTETGNGKFKVVESKWTFDILNDAGDARVRKETTIQAQDAIKGRLHIAEGYVEPMEWDWESDIRAWNEADEDLDIVVQKDHNNKKVFDIVFRDEVERNETHTYYFEYRWDSLFPFEEEYFETEEPAKDITFEIDAPPDAGVTNVWCEEMRRGVSTEISDVETTYLDQGSCVCDVEKSGPDCNVKINWQISGRD